MLQQPILYSFRRCPFAIRARIGLLYAKVSYTHREILLKDRPGDMLALSPKGTVPVLVLPNGKVLEESMDILRWALSQNDPNNWLTPEFGSLDQMDSLIEKNDFEFKQKLDAYKYSSRSVTTSPDALKAAAAPFLNVLEKRLSEHTFLFGERVSLADVAIFPFIRQFAFVDKEWFEQAPYPKLNIWLQYWLNEPLFLQAMQKHELYQESKD